MNKRCRLLLTTKCPNNCPLCCNKQFDLFKDVPIIDRWNYDEFILTGGEPLMNITTLLDFIYNLTAIHKYMGTSPKIYLYTSICNPHIWDEIIPFFDGITYTVHTQQNAKELITLITVLTNPEMGYDSMFQNLQDINQKSIWLNLFPEAKTLIDVELANTNLSWDSISRFFKIRQMEWRENCPIPEGEDFRRINNPW